MANKHKKNKTNTFQIPKISKAKVIVEVFDSDFGDDHCQEFIFDTKEEAKAMIDGFNIATDLCGNNALIARIKK